MSPDKPGQGQRIALLDAWRGVAVLVMLGWHLCWDLDALGIVNLGRMQTPAAVGVRYFIVCSFVLLSGISARYTHNGARRGLITLAGALAVTVTTLLAGEPAWFGILHLLGCCMLFYAWAGKWLERLPELPALLAYMTLFLILHEVCYRVRINIPGLFMFGLRTPWFRSSDYYPLFPWLFLFLTGTVLGGVIRRADGAWKTAGAPGPLVWLGKRALWVYLLHQPVLLAILAVLFGKTVW